MVLKQRQIYGFELKTNPGEQTHPTIGAETKAGTGEQMHHVVFKQRQVQVSKHIPQLRGSGQPMKPRATTEQREGQGANGTEGEERQK